MHRDGVKEAKGRLEINLARDAKNNNKGFYRLCQPEKEGQRKGNAPDSPKLANYGNYG